MAEVLVNSFATADAPDTTLAADINSSVTSLTVTSLPSGVPTDGSTFRILIVSAGGSEVILVGAVGGTGNLTWSSLTRHVESSATVSHTAGDPVYLINTKAGIAQYITDTYLPATAPGNSAVGDSAAAGSALTAARVDHRHGRESFATPAIVLGTAAAAGSAATPIRSDATILAFDSTAPANIGAAAAGAASVAARRDHVHAATYAQAFQTGDVTMTTAGTFYDGPSVTLAAGTWLISSQADLLNSTTGGAATAVWKLWDGSSAIYAAGTQTHTVNSGELTAKISPIVVVLSGSTTIKTSYTNHSTSGTAGKIKGTPTNDNTGLTNLATWITAIRIA